MPWYLLWQRLQRGAVALLVLLPALCGYAQTQVSSTVQTSYWQAPSEQTGLDDAMRATYQPFKHLIGLGYGRAPVWIKLTLPKKEAMPAGQDNTPYTVRVRPAYLDQVTLYDPRTGSRLESGDTVPPRVGEMVSAVFSFDVPALAQAHDVYLRVQTTSTRLMDVEVMTPAQAYQRDFTETIVMGLILSASLVFALGTTVVWWHQRERVIGLYAISQMVETVYGLMATGFARVLIGAGLPPGWLDTLFSVSAVLISVTTAWFIVALLAEYRPPRALLRAGYAMVFCMALLLPLGLWGDWMWALNLNAALLLFNVFLPILLLVFAQPNAQQAQLFPRRWLLLIFAVYLLVVAVNQLMFLGWVKSSKLVFYSGGIHILFNGLGMAVLLLLRAKAMERKKREMEMQLTHEQHQNQIEKQHREEQEKLFTMLAHELKTPLATMRMWLDAGLERRDIIERATANMNQVIERCVHTGQLGDQKLAPLFDKTDLTQATQIAIGFCRDAERVVPAWPALPAQVRSDAQILAIVLTNLLDNACKYSAAHTPIQVRLCPADHAGEAGWQWSILNVPGPAGLPAPEHVFEKYYRNPQARRQSGSGLGLFLVKGLVDLLQGTIRYAPGQEQVVFHLWLPGA